MAISVISIYSVSSAIEYTDCISTEGLGLNTHTTSVPRYGTKQFDSEAPVMLEL